MGVHCNKKLTEARMKKARTYLALCDNENKLPTLGGLALLINVSERTIHYWKDDPKFKDIYERVIDTQKETLIQKGLRDQYNPTITKLMLSSNHDMADKTKTDHTSDGQQIGGFNYITPKQNGDDNPDN